MKIAGITRVRNEEHIIQHTLDHVAQFVDGIFVFNDASEDNTAEICNTHPAVIEIVHNRRWDPTPQGRAAAEGVMRQTALNSAKQYGADWVYCFDADEFIEPFRLDFSADGYFFRLFDFYITPADDNKDFTHRQWMGPEYRDIPMVFRITDNLYFTQRVPRGSGPNIQMGGYVRHYGKAISAIHWEETCDYYINHRWKDRRPDLRKRWQQRKGKAVHGKSDFNRPLITWNDRVNAEKIVQI